MLQGALGFSKDRLFPVADPRGLDFTGMLEIIARVVRCGARTAPQVGVACADVSRHRVKSHLPCVFSRNRSHATLSRYFAARPVDLCSARPRSIRSIANCHLASPEFPSRQQPDYEPPFSRRIPRELPPLKTRGRTSPCGETRPAHPLDTFIIFHRPDRRGNWTQTGRR